MQVAFVHHTVSAVDYLPEESAPIILGIARYHRDSNGWNDIGYNFLVDRYGVIFEGRAGGVEAAVVGAQAQGYNSHSTGIACLGTFTNLPLDGPAMESLARLIGWKLSLHGAPVLGQVTLESGGGASNRYPSGTPVTFERVSGHRDADSTSCPGEALYAQLPALRSRASQFAVTVSAVTVRASTQRGMRPAAVSGVLRFSDGSSPAGATLGVEYMAAGSAWTQITTTNCAPDGAWSTSVTLPASGQVRAVFAGDAHARAPGVRAGGGPGRAEHEPHERQAPRARPARASRSRARWRRRSRASCACSSGRSESAGFGCNASASTSAAGASTPACARRRRGSIASRSSPTA